MIIITAQAQPRHDYLYLLCNRYIIVVCLTNDLEDEWHQKIGVVLISFSKHKINMYIIIRIKYLCLTYCFCIRYTLACYLYWSRIFCCIYISWWRWYFGNVYQSWNKIQLEVFKTKPSSTNQETKKVFSMCLYTMFWLHYHSYNYGQW